VYHAFIKQFSCPCLPTAARRGKPISGSRVAGSASPSGLTHALESLADCQPVHVDERRRCGLDDDLADPRSGLGRACPDRVDPSCISAGPSSGALADIVDRRRYFILTQFWAAGVAIAMCLPVLLGNMSPALLLAMTFANGIT